VTSDHRTDTSRERLIAAAQEAFVEHGYAGLTVGAIAKRAGFTTGAVYAHFASKEELVAEALAQAIEGRIGEILAGAARASSPAEAAHRLLVDILTTPLEPSDVLVLHGVAAATGDDARAALHPRLMQIVEVIRGLLERGREDGVVDADVELDVFLHMATTLALGSVAVKVLELPPPDEEQLLSVIARFEEAFAPRPAESDTSA
jgi:AcrR family transcriptional regulator